MGLDGQRHVVFFQIGNQGLDVGGQHVVGKLLILAEVGLARRGNDVFAAQAVRQSHVGAEIVQTLGVHEVAVAGHADERQPQRLGLGLDALNFRIGHVGHDVLGPGAPGGDFHIAETRAGDALQGVVHREAMIGVCVDGKNAFHRKSSLLQAHGALQLHNRGIQAAAEARMGHNFLHTVK